jgi:hypothetical protein
MINNQLKQYKKNRSLTKRENIFEKEKNQVSIEFYRIIRVMINQIFVYFSLLFYSNRFSYQINWIQIDLLAYSGLISLNSSLLFLRH